MTFLLAILFGKTINSFIQKNPPKDDNVFVMLIQLRQYVHNKNSKNIEKLMFKLV